MAIRKTLEVKIKNLFFVETDIMKFDQSMSARQSTDQDFAGIYDREQTTVMATCKASTVQHRIWNPDVQ